MVGKNLKYVLLLSGILAVAPAPLAADTGRKLGAFQKFGVAALGVQPDQATFGKIYLNAILFAYTKLLSFFAKDQAFFFKLGFKYIVRFLNAHDGILDTVVKGTKNALLTGTVEDLIKRYAGTFPDYVDRKEIRTGTTDLSLSLKAVCAAITVARCVYMMRLAQTILAQVEDECQKLGIESGVQKGFVPADDSYLVIDNPFKLVAMGAKQICKSFDAYQVPVIDADKWIASNPTVSSGLKAKQDEYFNNLADYFTNSADKKKVFASFGEDHERRYLEAKVNQIALDKVRYQRAQVAGDVPTQFKYLQSNFEKLDEDFVDLWTGDADRKSENQNRINPMQQKINGFLWAPFAITHFVGRTMVPYDTIKQLSPELQQALLDLVAFNTVNFYSFWV